MTATAQPAVGRWCPTCHDWVVSDGIDRCVWCQTTTRTAPRRRPGKPVGKHLTCISEELIVEAYQLYQTGLSVRAVAAQIHDRTTYKTPATCAEVLHQCFRRRGLRLRSQREATIAANTKHGRASRAQAAAHGADFAAYKRENRTRTGETHDVRCGAVNTNGRPCKGWAVRGSDRCVAHAEGALQLGLEAAWAARRLQMRPWGELRPIVEEAIRRFGRPSLTRQGGFDPSVMGRMLRYPDDHGVTPKTWVRFERAIAELAAGVTS